jgi:hypothetical protein
VHVHRQEVEAMRHPRTWIDLAYDRSDFAHQPLWVLYDRPNAEWLGLEAIRLPFSPAMFLVPLFGHTRGHCGVAIQDDNGWLFHCADACQPTPSSTSHLSGSTAWSLGRMSTACRPGPRPILKSACSPVTCGDPSLKGRGSRPNNLPGRRRPEREHGMK